MYLIQSMTLKFAHTLEKFQNTALSDSITLIKSNTALFRIAQIH